MGAARCVDCGGGTIIKNGTAVIQHTDPECPAASDFEPIANSTTGLRDILVPVTWKELLGITQAVTQGSKGAVSPEVHMTVGYNDTCVIEIRGKLLVIVEKFHPELRFKSGAEVWAYKRDSVSEKPELDTAIEVTEMWGMLDVYLQVDISEIFEIQIIHQPSPRAPVTLASKLL